MHCGHAWYAERVGDSVGRVEGSSGQIARLGGMAWERRTAAWRARVEIGVAVLRRACIQRKENSRSCDRDGARRKTGVDSCHSMKRIHGSDSQRFPGPASVQSQTKNAQMVRRGLWGCHAKPTKLVIRRFGRDETRLNSGSLAVALLARNPGSFWSSGPVWYCGLVRFLLCPSLLVSVWSRSVPKKIKRKKIE